MFCERQGFASARDTPCLSETKKKLVFFSPSTRGTACFGERCRFASMTCTAQLAHFRFWEGSRTSKLVFFPCSFYLFIYLIIFVFSFIFHFFFPNSRTSSKIREHFSNQVWKLFETQNLFIHFIQCLSYLKHVHHFLNVHRIQKSSWIQNPFIQFKNYSLNINFVHEIQKMFI